MITNMLYVHAVITKLNKSDQSQIVTANVDNPPLVPILKIVQRRKDLTKLIRSFEVSGSQGYIAIYQGSPTIRIEQSCIIKRFP
jgi:hypothetical protein